MNFLGFHFCHEEAAALLAAIPGLGIAARMLRAKLAERRQRKNKQCAHGAC